LCLRPGRGLGRLGGRGDWAGPVRARGCGRGQQALPPATVGLEVTGVDISQLAIERARAKARQRGLLAEFLVGDVLALPEVERLDPPFRTVFDVGCFHTFANADRPVYADSLARVVEPGGVLHLLCFSEHTPGTDGPRRVTQAEIQQTFLRDWRVDRIEADAFAVSNLWSGQQPNAWRARIIRR
jgi:SAM-dependent methyltransferase